MDRKDRKIVLLTATHYNNQSEVLGFTKHVNGLALPAGYELYIAVADNSENWDPELGEINNVSIFRPSENLGYLNGCAFALQCWSNDNKESPEWVGVVNTDIELSPEFMTKLLGQPFSDSVAVIAPDILLPSGERQNPHLGRRLTRIQILLYGWIFGNKILGRLYLLAHALRKEIQSFPRTDELDEQMVTIYAPHGSAIFFSELFFDAGGRLEYGGFLYCEELHVAEQALRNGLKIVWTPGISLRHNQHSTTSNLEMFSRIGWMHQSYRYIFEEYYRDNRTLD